MSDREYHDLMWNGIAYAVMAGASLVTLVGLYLVVPALRRRLLPLSRLRPGAWNGRDVVSAFVIFFCVPLLIVLLLFPMGFFVPLIGPAPGLDPPDTPALNLYLERASVISGPLILTAVLACLFAVLYIRSGTRPHHYGLSWSRWPANVALGLLAFVLATPLVLGIYALATSVYDSNLHKLTILGQHHPEWWEWALIGFQAVVAAPLLEEILVRGILQGWLRRATLSGHLGILSFTILLPGWAFASYLAEERQAGFEYGKLTPILFALLLATIYGWWMYRLTRRFALNELEIQLWQPLAGEPTLDPASEEERTKRHRQTREWDEQRRQQWADANATLAIFGSAMLFGLMHYVNWPAPIPLFGMGLVLGWLASRTQSLIGPITFHALFNLLNFIFLYGSVLTAPPQNGNALTTPVRPSVVGSMTTSVPASLLPLRK